MLLVALVVAGIVGATGWRLNSQEEAATGRRGPRATPVTVEAVATAPFAEIVEALGTARANESVTLTASVTQIVSRLAFESGEHVEAGQIIAELADAQEAAELNEARVEVVEAQRELARFEDLRARGVAPQARVDELATLVDRAKARQRAVEARLAELIVRAPFSGVVGLRNASPGMLVRPGDAIATLDDISVIKLDFSVPEVFLGVLAEGDQLEAETAAYPDEVFRGAITRIDTRVDPVTRAATVRAIIPNDDARLRPGMLMVVEVTRAERTSPAVPELALLRQGEQAFVYVAETRGDALVAAKRIVEPGVRRRGRIEILSGLEVGDPVVAEGVHRIQDGSPIAPIDARPVAGDPGEGGA